MSEWIPCESKRNLKIGRESHCVELPTWKVTKDERYSQRFGIPAYRCGSLSLYWKYVLGMAVLLRVIAALVVVVVVAVISHKIYLCEVSDPQVGDILKEHNVCQVFCRISTFV